VAPAPLSVLAIAEDCRGSTTLPRLWSVDTELASIEDTVRESALDATVEVVASIATVERVTDRIQSAHFVHFACHGTQHPIDALESGF
jgi:CHAT domain-containing protein